MLFLFSKRSDFNSLKSSNDCFKVTLKTSSTKWKFDEKIKQIHEIPKGS